MVHLIVAMQRFADHSAVSAFIRRCFRSVRASTCLELKLALNEQLSLINLLFDRMAPSDRATVLDHFEIEAILLRSQQDFFAPQLVLGVRDGFVDVLPKTSITVDFSEQRERLDMVSSEDQLYASIQRLARARQVFRDCEFLLSPDATQRVQLVQAPPAQLVGPLSGDDMKQAFRRLVATVFCLAQLDLLSLATMELLLPGLLFVVAALTVLWVSLVVKGLDPARLLRSAYKSPQHYLTPASIEERERLMRNSSELELEPAPGPRTAQTMLYSDVVNSLSDCATVADVEERLQFLRRRRLVNSDIKAKHFAQLCFHRLQLAALSPAALSAIVVALHRYVQHRSVAECVQRCVEATHGAATLTLKYELERHVSLFRLVYRRIRDAAARDAILEHLQREGEELAASPEFVKPTKLLCDIDDTMLSVLFDTRYPELTVYPGAHQFVHELLFSQRELLPAALFRSDEDHAARPHPGPRIAFLTARPELLRKRSVRELRKCGFFHFTLLMGRLSSAVLGPQRIAAGKLENFVQFRRLFAEHRFVFVGDNGQGDIDLGKALLRDPARFGEVVVLIHDVIRNHMTQTLRALEAAAAASEAAESEAASPPCEALPLPLPVPPSSAGRRLRRRVSIPYRFQEMADHGIHTFRTYVGAMGHLHARGLVSTAAVGRVAHKTLRAFASIAFETAEQRENLALEIAADLATVLASDERLRVSVAAAEQLAGGELPPDVRTLLAELLAPRRAGQQQEEQQEEQQEMRCTA
ncbi:hypothetical protein P43SY_009272 [Pythium insidiosum]|uniref:Phosphatidate phosphatase APP1 catalytic domain-containing protein n=1 Tax=Pythium insidiosum TaxID=114742 RepID=A0AAD5M2I4_PYTIN|nr:hypothetical protein P43SY_009272 [Pythium insidiosum]